MPFLPTGVTAMTADSWLRQVKQRVKPGYLRGRRWLARTLHAYDVPQLQAALRELGLAPGDSVFLHAGFAPDSGFSGTPADLLDAVIDVLGADGHLLMMSMAYGGASAVWAATDPLFDVRRTPSALGIVSEVFRRRPGALRSASPLHPVLAQGPLAAWLVADHERLAHSCGRGTPFERLLRLDAHCVFIDAPYNALTFMHYVEDSHCARLPVTLYEPTPVQVRMVDGDGRERRVAQYCFSAEARARRHFVVVEEALRRSGQLREAAVGNSRLLAVRASDVLATATAVLDAGGSYYQ